MYLQSHFKFQIGCFQCIYPIQFNVMNYESIRKTVFEGFKFDAIYLSSPISPGLFLIAFMILVLHSFDR